MLGLATVLAGDVEVLGAPVGRLPERGRVGYVPQRHTVSGAVPATVREVVGVGRLARLGLFRRLGAADRRPSPTPSPRSASPTGWTTRSPRSPADSSAGCSSPARWPPSRSC